MRRGGKIGRKFSEEARRNMRAAQQRRLAEGAHNFHEGHVVPQEWRDKCAEWHKGRKQSPETIAKRAAAMRATAGKRKPVSEAGRLNMSLSHRGKRQSPELIKKRMDSRKGYRPSEVTRIKMSVAQRKPIGQTKMDESKAARRHVEYKLWREAVMGRDNWTCQKSKIRGGKLHPHHILNFAEHPELRFDVNNGVTLSEKEHKAFHKRYGQRNNTREQLLEFLAA